MRRGCRLCREDLPLEAFGKQAAVCFSCRNVVRMFKRYGHNIDAMLDNKIVLCRMRAQDEARKETKFRSQLDRYRKIANKLASE